ncbi:hypothetical protein GCM10009000_041200 [Halobacterium noricense]|uniref:Pyrrolo-quinoline quinone repeat domain-containing protein n=2 Tax=Haladaptatus pallidirubidus TaxID=1008152 RepID=A0AAV3UGC1_9EURY
MGATSYGSSISIARNANGLDWKRPGGWIAPRAGPSRTGVTDQNGPTPYAVTDWRIDLDGSMYDTDPVVADETLYLSVTTNNTPGEYGGYIGAYDAETGDEQWKRPDLPAPKTPAIDDQTIYFSTQVPETPDSDDIGFHALDADSGDTVWNRTDHNHWSHPIVTENKIYTSNRDATFALHRETGDTIWKAGGVSGFSDDVGDALSYTDGTLFVSDGTALDAEDGSTKWAVSSDECTLGNPAVHNGMIYYTQTEHIVGDDDRVKVQARSAETGEVEWVHREDGNAWDGRPAITENHVLFVNSSDGESIVTALDSTTGETVWATMIRGTSFSSPVVGNGTVYLGGQYVPESDPSAGRALIHALDDATGDQLWSYLLGSSGLETSPEDPPAAGAPVVADGKMYVATYPAGSTLDYQYVYYSNFFVLDSCAVQPDEDHRLPEEDESDCGDDAPDLEACIEAISDVDWSDLNAGDVIQLIASCSTRSDLRYEWDIDGDGRYEETGSTVSVTVPTFDSMTVGLRVTDSNGDTDTTSVSVSPN